MQSFWLWQSTKDFVIEDGPLKFYAVEEDINFAATMDKSAVLSPRLRRFKTLIPRGVLATANWKYRAVSIEIADYRVARKKAAL